MFPSLGLHGGPSSSDGMNTISRYRRKDSAIRTLVAETLVLAKTHGYVEKIENELEEEILQEETYLPKEDFVRWRRKGYSFFKSKAVLLTVVILCIVDCALVLGELTLDLYKVKVTLEDNEEFTNSATMFLLKIKQRNPEALGNKEYDQVFDMISTAEIKWNLPSQSEMKDHYQLIDEATILDLVSSRNRRSVGANNKSATNSSHIDIPKREYSIEESIAHALHLASISILGIILLETLLKAICAGRPFFHRKLEVFDAFLVIVSFVADIILLVALPDYNTRDFVFILAFLLPWRVIRVVDSLVVAVKDHEHFRLKLVYKRKKKIQTNLREMEVKAQIFQYQCNALRRLCLSEGLDEWKIDQCVKAEQKYQSTLGKRKGKIRLETSSMSPLLSDHSRDRSPRPSIPSLDLQGFKFWNGNSIKHNELNGSIEEKQSDKSIDEEK
ncbi:uncharacterized protein LOC133175833 [Saccostrea echinata]|uniref:uncharacterized protein LOC133175833 n=1 Tax=Saccostrea echinata TaxID=191078 RepID=UPI002A8372D5|nr:uncharacterized protein LOC133175833 [Saccostrea echinata]